MVIAFDYKGFSKDIKKQAEELMPEDIATNYKKDFLDRIYNFTYLAGEAFSTDDSIESPDTAKVLTQLISEWTFHKYIDLLRSEIPQIYHESILQKVAYVAFEMAKESVLGKLSEEQMLTLVEAQISKAYENACKKLLENNQISQVAFDSAMKKSNVDEYSDKLCHNIKVIRRKKIKTFPVTLFALLFGILIIVANIFWAEDLTLIPVNTFAIIVLSMCVGLYIGAKYFEK